MEKIPFPIEISQVAPFGALPLSCASNASSGAPAMDSAAWARKSSNVLLEAEGLTARVSKRRWMVVHPDDAVVFDLLTGFTFNKSIVFESPHVLRWLSSSDGRVYWLMEYLALRRQT